MRGEYDPTRQVIKGVYRMENIILQTLELSMPVTLLRKSESYIGIKGKILN